MVRVAFGHIFRKNFSKIKNASLKNKIITQISKLKVNPLVGKPMRYSRKGTREIYIKPFRLSYMYIEKDDKVILLDLYHKNKQ